MELLDVIKRPVITEKSMLAMDEKKYTFEVDTRANKTLVKQAVESAFDVKVANVNILNVRQNSNAWVNMRVIQKRRKAIVTLTEDSKEIQLFEAAE